MRSPHLSPVASEKGAALIIVLLLLAVMSALTTGLAMSGQTEIAMASNEMYHAGARAAAEAGLNRAFARIIADNTINMLAGPDNEADPLNPGAAVNADNAGVIPGAALNCPAACQVGDQYSYTIEILDDDDPALYPVALTGAQLAKMGEDGNRLLNANERLILRATGMGPRGTRVVLSRVVHQDPNVGPDIPNDPIESNPAILVDGSLSVNGSVNVEGTHGNIHTNGDITGNVSGTITGQITATGAIDSRLTPNGGKAPNMAPVAVPEIRARDYQHLADWILKADGSIQRASDHAVCGDKTLACPSGWGFKSGTWSSSGAMPQEATYYVEGPISIHGTGKGSDEPKAVSIIAEGSIEITGNGNFKPANNADIQFVTNGDFKSNALADEVRDLDGEIMVREQIKLQGGFKFQGRVTVKNMDSAANVYHATNNRDGRRGDNVETGNDINGNITVTYNGSLDPIDIPVPATPGAVTYANSVVGWIEQ